MRRRPRLWGEVEVPAYLATYAAADWPDGCHPSCAFWRAREAFEAGLTDEQREDLPFDALDRIDRAVHLEDI